MKMAPHSIVLLVFVATANVSHGLSLGSYRLLGDSRWLHGADGHDHSSSIATDFMDSYNRESDVEFTAGEGSEQTHASTSTQIESSSSSSSSHVINSDAIADPWAQLTGTGSGSSWSSWPWGGGKHASDSSETSMTEGRQEADDRALMKVTPSPVADTHSDDRWESPHFASQEDRTQLDSAEGSKSREMEDMMSRARTGTLSTGYEDGVGNTAVTDNVVVDSVAVSSKSGPSRQRSFSAGLGEPVPVSGGQVMDIKLDSELQESLLQSLRR